MVKDIFFIRSKKEDAGVEYAGISAFCCGFVPEKAVANY
jgi:HSP20 family protein